MPGKSKKGGGLEVGSAYKMKSSGFKLRSGNGPLKFKDMGSSPLDQKTKKESEASYSRENDPMYKSIVEQNPDVTKMGDQELVDYYSTRSEERLTDDTKVVDLPVFGRTEVPTGEHKYVASKMAKQELNKRQAQSRKDARNPNIGRPTFTGTFTKKYPQSGATYDWSGKKLYSDAKD